MKKILNYYELKAVNREYQERLMELEGEEKVALEEEYREWQKEQEAVKYCKVWNEMQFGICPECENKECECPAEEIEVIYDVVEEDDEE